MNLLPLIAALLIILWFDRPSGTLSIFAIVWLIAMVPMATGIIHYNSFDERDYGYVATLGGYLAAFVAGSVLTRMLPRRSSSGSEPVDGTSLAADFLPVFAIARLVWWVAMTGTGLAILDFALLGGEGLSDLASLRDTIVERTSASIYAQLSSVLTWGCLYCYIFAIVYRPRLSRTEFVRMIVPVGGYFMLSVFSAGRQAAFQIMIVTVLTLVIVGAMTKATQPRQSRRRTPQNRGFVAVVSAAMIGYMGYIAVARVPTEITDVKADILASLFDFSLAEPLATALAQLPDSVRSAIVEGLVYFTHSIWLFQKFLGLTWSKYYYGAFTFPFVFRQIQGFTGVSPGDGLIERVATINAAGYIGAGWVSGIASFIQDVGRGGAVVAMFVVGFYTNSVWQRAVRGYGFHVLVIAVLGAVTIVYLPLFTAISDTNLFLLWLFALVAGRAVVHRRAPSIPNQLRHDSSPA